MPTTIQPEPNNIYVMHLSGVVMRSEFENVQTAMTGDIDAGAKPRVLAILENFNGWERGADWGDLEFLFSHSHEIAKIAIVGEQKWEQEALAFAGAGFRRAPVKFFPASQVTEARAWLAQ